MTPRSLQNGSWGTDQIAGAMFFAKTMPSFFNWLVLPLPIPLGRFILSPRRAGATGGWQSYFACKGQFVGINTTWLKCDLARDVIQKMQYEGESLGWNWDEHCTKFHQQLCIIDEWAVASLAIPMSAEDQISAFLKTIPKDCKNVKLLIAKGESD